MTGRTGQTKCSCSDQTIEKTSTDLDDGESQSIDDSEFGGAISGEDFENFVDCDKDGECFGTLTDTEICSMVKRNHDGEVVDVEDEDDDEIAQESTPMSHSDALKHLRMVQKYTEENFTEYDALYEIQEMIEKNFVKNRHQSKITDFFGGKKGDKVISIVI